ncbi:hypothetical protein RP20_CCG016659 [Aedes albopictus]|nr:hypothetical protein RP20_CCG016659 [Aedes albopictus]
MAGVRQGQLQKRKLAVMDGNDIPDLKWNTAPVDVTTKQRIWGFLIHIHESMRILYGVGDRENVDTYAEMTSHVLSIHNRKRQEQNGVGTVKDKVANDKPMIVAETPVGVATMIELYDVVANMYGIKYERNSEAKKTIRTLSSVLSLIACYKDRFNEVRVGVPNIVVRKTPTEVLQTPLYQFGLETHHQVTLSGVNYTLAKQLSVKGSLGPMTTAYNLATTQHATYRRTWERLFCQVFKFIPNHIDIAAALAGSMDQNMIMMRHLADLSLWGVTRSVQKAHFPMALILQTAYLKCAAYKVYWDGRTLENINQAFDFELYPQIIANIDFSGHGALGIWNAAGCCTLRMKGTEAMSSRMASELFFHAVWGTHMKDLGYLQWLTNHAFLTRKDIGAAVQKRGTSENTVLCPIIPFRYFSKLANASLSNMTAGAFGQICPISVFSGRRQVHVDLDGPLLKTLAAHSANVAVGGLITVDRLNHMLLTLKTKIRDQVMQDRSITLETTQHFAYDEASQGAAYGAPVGIPAVCTGRFFYE